MENKYRYQIISNQGEIRSQHKTYEAGGNNKSGWGKCSHGNQNRVCSATHYNDKIVQIA